MIIIHKKRIQIITICLCMGIFAFFFPIASNKGEETNKNTVATTSTPVSGKTIVIDAGHGVPDGGDSLLKFVIQRLQIAINQ